MPSLVDPISVVADFGDLCGEGPLWDPLRNCLYWTDIARHRLYRLDWKTRTTEVLKDGLEANGIALNERVGFVFTNRHGIWSWDGQDGTRLIAKEIEGVRCQMNDCIADPAGRLLAGSTFYSTESGYPLGHLMHVDTDGSVRILDDGIHMANGLAFSPDGGTLYLTDSGVRRIYSYAYDARAGQAKNRRVLIQVSEEEGLPDGLTVDAEGFLWSAQWFRSCIVRYDPDGRIATYFNASQANVVNRVWRSESHRHIRDLSRNVEGSANHAVRLRSASGIFRGALVPSECRNLRQAGIQNTAQTAVERRLF